MGADDSKHKKPTGPPPPDMNEVLIGMKMKSKMFHRSAQKALKEKAKYYELAKKQLKAGNEEGAHAYLELANTQDQENKQFMRMAVRLETLSVQIRSKQNSVDMVNNLNMITPVLQLQSTEIPLEQMYKQLEGFNTAYDDLSVKGVILDQNMETTLASKGGYKNVDNMMNGLKADVAMEMGVPMEQVDPTANQNAQANTQANADFYDNLKAM